MMLMMLMFIWQWWWSAVCNNNNELPRQSKFSNGRQNQAMLAANIGVSLLLLISTYRSCYSHSHKLPRWELCYSFMPLFIKFKFYSYLCFIYSQILLHMRNSFRLQLLALLVSGERSMQMMYAKNYYLFIYLFLFYFLIYFFTNDFLINLLIYYLKKNWC